MAAQVDGVVRRIGRLWFGRDFQRSSVRNIRTKADTNYLGISARNCLSHLSRYQQFRLPAVVHGFQIRLTALTSSRFAELTRNLIPSRGLYSCGSCLRHRSERIDCLSIQACE